MIPTSEQKNSFNPVLSNIMLRQEEFHFSHANIRFSMSAVYDFVCEDCGHTDYKDRLMMPCPNKEITILEHE